jgi:hypothetical protein
LNVYLTYDYELFFGDPTGSVEKCIIEPTNFLRQIAKDTGVKMVFFIDVGYLKKLEEFRAQFPLVEHEYQLVFNQIKDLVAEGHDCQLHIHPHWEDCTHDGCQWKMIVDRYKLIDFSEEEIIEIVLEYKSILKSITQKPIIAYRAGGWCLQPFSKIQKAFSKAGLKIDSTVFPGGENKKGNYFYDFKNTPNKDKWQFSSDLCEEDVDGEFWEFPISNQKYSIWFFWRLFILGRLQPKLHKPIGDGYPMPSPGMRKQMLTKGMTLSASVDGYFVTKLNQVVKRNQYKGWEETVIIGHPKACTHFALKQLKKFILKQQLLKVNFKVFSDC